MIFHLPGGEGRDRGPGGSDLCDSGPVMGGQVSTTAADHPQALPIRRFLKPLREQPSKYFPVLPPPSPSSLFPALSGIYKKSGERMIIAPRGTHLP